MILISHASKDDCAVLAELGRQTFIESHGHSASAEAIKSYLDNKYAPAILSTELNHKNNNYHLLYYHQKLAGYSNLILNAPPAVGAVKNICKLDRLYLLKEYYNHQLGKQLFEFNIEFSKKNEQVGMCLYVWIENHRAVKFYKKAGFEIIGMHDFKISETHSNPNHQMLLMY
jgi:diamine N-acetyltransferase